MAADSTPKAATPIARLVTTTAIAARQLLQVNAVNSLPQLRDEAFAPQAMSTTQTALQHGRQVRRRSSVATPVTQAIWTVTTTAWVASSHERRGYSSRSTSLALMR
ncbi:MAG: hypothetical protein A2040_00960 [Rhodocyclales bacterium GWA2_65_19]|nr:MAG: hypothetical protein A2040_00960 [Rhodocyclales bacterium GWA2_65_19]